jgi:hypothetical protein
VHSAHILFSCSVVGEYEELKLRVYTFCWDEDNCLKEIILTFHSLCFVNSLGVFGSTLIAAKAMNLTEVIATFLFLSTRNLSLSPNTFFHGYGYVSVNICMQIDVFKRQPRVSRKNRRLKIPVKITAVK